MKTINKHTVLKETRENGTWFGYIAPSNVNAYHITEGWHLGMDIHIATGRDNKPYVISYNAQDFEALETYLNNFKYYNCNAELGKRVRFWSID